MAADSEKSLDITIRTKAELSGAQALGQELERKIGQAKALGDTDALKKLQPQLSAVNDSLRTAQVSQEALSGAEHAGAEAAEHSHVSHRALHKLLHEMGNVTIPGFGGALSSLMFGPLGAVIALVSVFEAVKHSIEESEAEMDKLNDILSKPLTGGIEEVRKAWDEATAALAKYYSQMQHAGEEKDPIGKEIKNIKELSDAQIDAAKKVAEALGKQEVAAIRARDAAAGKSREDTEKDVQRAEDKTRRMLESLDAGKESGNVELLKYEQQRRLQDSDRLQREAVAANEKARQAEIKYRQDETTKKNALQLSDPNSEEGKVIAKQIEDALAKLETAKSASDFVGGPIGGPPIDMREVNKKAMEEAQTELDRLNGLVSRAKTLAEKLNGSQFARDEAHDNAQADAEAAKAKSLTNQERLNQLPGEVDHAQKLEGIHDAARREVDQASSPNTPKAAANVELGEHLAKIPIQKMDQESRNHLMSIAHAVDAHVTTLQEAVTTLQKSAAVGELHNRAILQISKKLDEVSITAERALNSINLM